MSDSRYLSAADTAKLIRKAIKREFPAIKFGVTTSTYSMGASVSIQWVDGPTTKQVDHVVGAFKGKGFDGMVDCGYYYNAWLLPDGTATIAKCKSSGTTVTPYENEKPHPDAELVSFGSDYINTSRHHSPAFVRRVAAEMEEKTRWTAPEILEQDSYWSRSKTVPTAYFERGSTPDEDTTEREFTQALYLTPGDGPLVTSFDYAFEEPEPTPEPAGEPDEAENKAIHEATVREIAENRERNDQVQAEADARQEASIDPKTIAHEDRTPEKQAEVETVWAETLRQIEEPKQDSLAAGFYQAVQEVANEIMGATDSSFIHRCVVRKIRAVASSNDIHALIQVGDDLLAISEGLGLA